MANVTDLTRYTWQANDTIGLIQFETLSYNINFLSNNTNYTKLTLEWHSDDYLYSSLNYGSIEVYSDIELEPVWLDTNYKIVEFIDGDDVTNSSLINWLEENGTLTKGGTKNLKLGADAVKMYLGNTELNKVYLGTELLYEK